MYGSLKHYLLTHGAHLEGRGSQPGDMRRAPTLETPHRPVCWLFHHFRCSSFSPDLLFKNGTMFFSFSWPSPSPSLFFLSVPPFSCSKTICDKTGRHPHGRMGGVRDCKQSIHMWGSLVQSLRTWQGKGCHHGGKQWHGAGGRGILNNVLRASTWEAGPECRVRAQTQQGGRPLDGQRGAE